MTVAAILRAWAVGAAFTIGMWRGMAATTAVAMSGKHSIMLCICWPILLPYAVGMRFGSGDWG